MTVFFVHVSQSEPEFHWHLFRQKFWGLFHVFWVKSSLVNERIIQLLCPVDCGLNQAAKSVFEHLKLKVFPIFRHEDLKSMLDGNKDNVKLEAMKRIIGVSNNSDRIIQACQMLSAVLFLYISWTWNRTCPGVWGLEVPGSVSLLDKYWCDNYLGEARFCYENWPGRPVCFDMASLTMKEEADIKTMSQPSDSLLRVGHLHIKIILFHFRWLPKERMFLTCSLRLWKMLYQKMLKSRSWCLYTWSDMLRNNRIWPCSPLVHFRELWR